MNELHLFAGAGGGILGGMLLGHTCVCAVEIEPYPRKVLLQRQRDEILPKFPIWDDIRTFDGKPWRGHVDIVCGGFPCQDISAAGKGAGLDGERSGLWSEMARVIREVQPRFVFVENSPMLTIRGLGVVLGDLAAMGYDARWGVLGASDAGGVHRRERIWILANFSRLSAAEWRQVSFAGDCIGYDEETGELGDECSICGLDYSEDCRCPGPTEDGFEYVERDGILYGRASSNAEMPGQPPCNIKAQEKRQPLEIKSRRSDSKRLRGSLREWIEAESGVCGVAHGLAYPVDRLKAIGNGQVPAVAALAWEILSENV